MVYIFYIFTVQDSGYIFTVQDSGINSIYFRIFGGDYTRRPSRRICESHWKKMIGKPCAGKLHARFDEGELEIGLLPLRQFSTLPVRTSLPAFSVNAP
jgi:hypothetical protein